MPCAPVLLNIVRGRVPPRYGLALIRRRRAALWPAVNFVSGAGVHLVGTLRVSTGPGGHWRAQDGRFHVTRCHDITRFHRPPRALVQLLHDLGSPPGRRRVSVFAFNSRLFLNRTTEPRQSPTNTLGKIIPGLVEPVAAPAGLLGRRESQVIADAGKVQRQPAAVPLLLLELASRCLEPRDRDRALEPDRIARLSATMLGSPPCDFKPNAALLVKTTVLVMILGTSRRRVFPDSFRPLMDALRAGAASMALASASNALSGVISSLHGVTGPYSGQPHPGRRRRPRPPKRASPPPGRGTPCPARSCRTRA